MCVSAGMRWCNQRRGRLKDKTSPMRQTLNGCPPSWKLEKGKLMPGTERKWSVAHWTLLFFHYLDPNQTLQIVLWRTSLTAENLSTIIITEGMAPVLIRLLVQLEAAKGKLVPGDGGSGIGFHWITKHGAAAVAPASLHLGLTRLWTTCVGAVIHLNCSHMPDTCMP